MLLISTTEWERYRELVRNLSYGKVLPTATYIHRSAEVFSEGPIAGLLLKLSQHHGVGEEFNVVKFRTDAARLSFLQYSAFFDEAHPCLEEAISIDLISGRWLRTTYRDSLNPPILHRKELMLSPDHPRFREFEALSAAEDEAGMYANTAVIGFRVNWERLLASRGLAIEGHTLAREEGGFAVNGKESVEMRVAIQRHKTAITRYELSRPVKTLIEYSQLKPGCTLLDYGCGLGGDIRSLAALGFDAKGWDPTYAPDAPRCESDVVNLGYVLNVIEDPAERLETLLAAWRFAKRLLVVSAQVGDANPGSIALNDGVITKRNTFQKYFGQQELQSYIEDAVRGEFINQAAIGVWYNPRQCFCQRYEAKFIGDAGPPGSGRRPSNPACVRCSLKYS